MNTVTFIVILCTTLEIHFTESHEESIAEDQFDDVNDKINYQDSDQISAFEDKNEEANEKFDSQELEALQDQNVGSNEKLRHQKSEFSEERNVGKKLNDFNLDATDDDDGHMIEPKTLKDKESHEKNNESITINRDVQDDDANEDDENNVDKGQVFDGEVAVADENDADNREMDAEMEKEREAGDAADLFGTNQHYNIPVNYLDFGRRFVLMYPYIEKNILNDAAETELDNTVKEYLQSKKSSKKEITPMKAPPQFVLDIAKQSALLEASKPRNPTDDIIQKDILRTGNYWDGVWKEEVDVDKILRSNNEKLNQLESVKVNILPGSKLHKLMTMLKRKSPRFIYVINKSS